MNSKAVITLLTLVLLAGIGGAVWFLNTGTDEPSLETAKETPHTGDPTAEKDAVAATPRRQAAPTAVVWKLRGKGALVGRLLEYGTEKPVAGLSIKLVATGGPETTLTTESRADGSFSLLGIANFDQWTLQVAAKAPFREIEMPSITVVENQQTDVGTIYLSPSFVVKGTVINDNGAGVEGVTVYAQRVGGADSRFDVMKLIRELGADVAYVDSAVTAKDGSFELKKTPPGTYDFLLSSEVYAARSERNLPVTPDAEKRPLRFTMSRGYELEGHVVRKDGGSPAKIRIVAMTNPEQERSFLNPTKIFTVSDDSGNFKFKGLPAGRLVVAAAVPDRPMAMSDDVRVPQTGYVDVVVGGDSSVFGRVVDENAQPIVGAEVSAILQRRSPTVAAARTAEDGSYEMIGMPTEKIQMLLVKADGFAPYPDDMSMMMRGPRGGQADELKPGRNERNFTLKRGATVRGIVKTKDGGKPIEGARVSVAGMSAMFTGTPGATTGPDGKFEIKGIGKGAAIVTASKEGFQGVNPSAGMMAMMMGSQSGRAGAGDAEKPQGMIDVKELGTELDVTLELSVAPIFSGRIVDPEGRPVVGARVSTQVVSKDNDMGRGFRDMMNMAIAATRFSDSEGRFEIPGDAEKGASIEVVAKAPGFVETKSEPRTVTPGEKISDITIQMRRGGTIEGRVVADNGNAVEGANVRWLKNGKNSGGWEWDRSGNASATTNADGRFTLSTIEPGKVSVRATFRGLAAAVEHEIAVAEDSKASITLTMVKGLAISGRVVDAAGQPIVRARINHWLVNDNGNQGWSAGSEDVRTGQDGTFEIAGLPNAEFELHASADDFADSERRKVTAGTTGVEFVLPKALTIKGKVFSNGTPIAGIRVSAGPENDRDNSRGSSEMTGPDGSFTIDRLAPGVYTVKAEANWWMGDESAPNVMPGKVTGIVAGAENVILNLEPGAIISGQVMRADGGSTEGSTVNASSDFSSDESGGEREYIHRSARVKNGRFEIRGLKPGKYMVQIEISEYSSKRVRVTAPANDVSVTLGGGCRLTGRVLRDDGTPVANVYVSFYSETGSDGSVRTREDGTYSIEGLEPGNYHVSAWVDNRSGRIDKPVEVPASGQISLPDMTVRGEKTDENR